MSTPAGDGLVGDATIRVDGDTDPAMRALRRFARDVDRRLRDVRSSFTSEGTLINRALTNAAGGGDRFGSTLSGITRVAGRAAGSLTLVGGAAGGAAPLLAGLATTLQSIVPAGAVAVSGMLAVQQASAALKLGMIGVGDAVTAAFDTSAEGAEAFAEALEKLSPSARAFAEEVRELAPAFTEFQQSVQEELFTGLDSTLKTVANATLPALQDSLVAMAATFNRSAKGIAAEAEQLGRDGTLGKALQGGADAFENLVDLPAQLLGAITRLAVGGAPLLERITERIAEFGDSASKALEDASETGALQDAINEAAEVIQQLGRIAGNVFGAISNAMNIAGENGGNLFDSLERVTQALEDITETQEFADVLGALIGVGTTLAATVLPILAEAFKAIAPVFETLAPFIQDFVTLLGEQLMRIIPELAPVLVELAAVFGQILVAVEPLIVALTDILIAVLPSLVPLFQQLARVVEELAPLIEFFAVGVSTLLIPVLRFLVGGITQVVDWLATLIGWIADGAEAWGRLANGTIRQVVLPALLAVAQFLSGDYSRAWDTARGAAARWGVSVVANVRNAMSGVVGGINSGMANATGRVQSGFQSILTAISNRLSDAVGRVRAFPGRVQSALGGLSGVLFASGRAMIQGLINGILSKLGDAVAAAQRIVSAVRDFFPGSPAKRGPFSGKGYTLFSGQAISESIAEGILQRQRMVQRAAAQVTQTAQNALSMPATTAVADLGVSTLRPQPRTTVVVHNTVQLTNQGVIGSRIEVQDWLARALDSIDRTGRLPSGLRTA